MGMKNMTLEEFQALSPTERIRALSEMSEEQRKRIRKMVGEDMRRRRQER